MENTDKLSPRSEAIKDNRFLAWVEATGNKLPHPFLLFVYLAVFIMVLSAVLNYFGINTYNPKTAETYPIKSLLSGDGVAYMFTNFVKNFVNFPPLGTIITVMLGIGLAERVGLLSTLLTQTAGKDYETPCPARTCER
ncbi:AbgT family transporter [Vibrio sp. 1401]|uniref:AbgT family transporter n=1 Tax=Vibrio sp. 1401 TaxID=3074553 RepID=UPI0029649488|nr:AbgT family transporter [Vibrio sp. 1401]MDW2328505.1 AbgT family transporter [Vibrio sp. 1401]